MSVAGFGPSPRETEQRMLDMGAKWSGSYWFVEGNGSPTLLKGTRPPVDTRAAVAPARTAQRGAVYTAAPRLTDARREGAKYGQQYYGDAWGCATAWGWHVTIEPQASIERRHLEGDPVAYVDGRSRTIHVSSDLGRTAQNHAIAHELGHACLGHVAVPRSGSPAEHEDEAQAFANAFVSYRPRA